MEKVLTGECGKKYTISDKYIAKGGEGSIYLVEEDQNVVIKIFKAAKRASWQEEKIKMMVQEYQRTQDINLNQLTWPIDVVYDENGFCGYVMQRLRNISSLPQIYNDNKYDMRARLFVAINLCAAIDSIHAMNQVCGDLNPQNICVYLDELQRENLYNVVLVDTDSYHITKSGKVYRCGVGLGDYIAPEVQKKLANTEYNLKSLPLPTYTRETDLFALSVHIFCLLMNGCHPFACATEQNPAYADIEQITENTYKNSVVVPQPVENIKTGMCVFFKKKQGITTPIYSPDIQYLPETIINLFHRAFIEGYENPTKRPAAEEWKNTLVSIAQQLNKSCEKKHFYFLKENREICPYCEVESKISEVIYNRFNEKMSQKEINWPSLENGEKSEKSSQINEKSTQVDYPRRKDKQKYLYAFIVGIIMGSIIVVIVLANSFNPDKKITGVESDAAIQDDEYSINTTLDETSAPASADTLWDDVEEEEEYISSDDEEEYVATPAPVSNTNKDYILPQSSTRKLKRSEVEALSKKQLRYARNEIYARHGRGFHDKELQDYFDSKDWYIEFIDADNFEEKMLSKIERHNVRLIQQYE